MLIAETENKIDQLLLRYKTARNLTVNLTKGLEIEDFVVQPIVDVSPIKWHLAHTTWFFEEFVLCKFLENYARHDKQYAYLFNSYYNHIGTRWARAERGHLPRPTVKEIIDYRQAIDKAILGLKQLNLNNAELHRTMEIGINHEQQHQELMMYDVKNILGTNPLFPKLFNRNNKPSDLVHDFDQFVDFKGGIINIGHQESSFCFDNEQPTHRVFIEPFKLRKGLITNGEFLAFIEDGGYQKFECWLDEGLQFIQENMIKHPLYWLKEDELWYEYQLSGLEPLDLNAAVCHLSYYEADAFAKWAGYRLPSEFEWEHAYESANILVEHGNFVENQHFAVLQANKQEGKLYQMAGHCWEWTQSAYSPYPNYKAEMGAIGEYNGKFMVNQMVLRGGSCYTQMEHFRPTYRNFFHPDKRWLMAGIRLAKKGE